MACTTSDIQNWKDHVFATFPSVVNRCGAESLSVESVARTCLQSKLDLSSACIECAVQEYTCMREHCVNACISIEATSAKNSFAQVCLDCLHGENNARFDCVAPAVECLGFDPFTCSDCKPAQPEIIAGLENSTSYALFGALGAFTFLAICILYYLHRRQARMRAEDPRLPPLEKRKPRYPEQQITHGTGMMHAIRGAFGINSGVSAPASNFQPGFRPEVPAPLAVMPAFTPNMLPIYSPTGIPTSVPVAAGYAEGSMPMIMVASAGTQLPRGAQPFVPMSPAYPGGAGPANPGGDAGTRTSAAYSVTSDMTQFQSEVIPLRARFSFHGRSKDELTVEEGALVDGIRKEGEWFLAVVPKTGRIGLIPGNYLEPAI